MQPANKVSPLRRPFVAAGAVTGVVLSGYYLYRNAARATLVPDPVWTRFVNVALIVFCSIYLANLLRRLVERLRSKP